jgi:predicted unusual protein kinase regulating ubiquinone biosynthesis (AarF/ABC1/UbiB family)
VHGVLAEQIGPRWRQRFTEFDDDPAAAASIGQVHRAVWRDGRVVAVKIQYPGAGQALKSDLAQIGRMMRLVSPLYPGLDVAPLVDELQRRMHEELDYRREARAQRAFGKALRDDPDFVVPEVIFASDEVLVSEWIDGKPVRTLIESGSAAERNRTGLLMARLFFSGPARAHQLHADPHPGNFRLLADDRLGRSTSQRLTSPDRDTCSVCDRR